MMKMHEGQVDIDTDLVARLLAAQFPELSALPITAVQSTGTVNALFRLGDGLCARLPLVEKGAESIARELEWLPWPSGQLSMRVPEPIASGEPTDFYPFPWAIYRWIEGRQYSDELVDDARTAARDLARFIIELRAVEPVSGAPRRAPASPYARQRNPNRNRRGGRLHRLRCSHGGMGALSRSAGLGRKTSMDTR